MVMVEHQYEQTLQQDTSLLVETMKFSEQLTSAVLHIRDYIPNLQSENYQKFWKEKVSHHDE